MAYRTIEVAPLAGALGAEISGVDLSKPLGNEMFSEIHQAFLDHLVIFSVIRSFPLVSSPTSRGASENSIPTMC